MHEVVREYGVGRETRPERQLEEVVVGGGRFLRDIIMQLFN